MSPKCAILPLLMDVSIYTIVFLAFMAFIAGFVDAIVGGGGLIMVPSVLVAVPSAQVSQAIGTTKIPALSGISMAAYQYAHKIKLNWYIVLPSCLVAFLASFTGSWLLTQVSNDFMKPFLLLVLSLVAVYTYIRKDFGQHTDKAHSEKQKIQYACLLTLFVGFYDGFIGPGGGSFYLMAFVVLLGFNFLQASAYAKMANASSNFASVILFVAKGKVVWSIAIPMAVGAIVGSLLGSRYAMAKGNAFVRKFFLIVVCVVLLRFAYDVFWD